MNQAKIKKFVLAGLIFTSIIQVGILWDFSSHGFPFDFYRAFHERVAPVSASVKKMKSELFSPKRIIVSTGAYQSNWIINKDGDTQDIYNTIWNDAKIYIGEIVADNNIESFTMSDEKWTDIVQRKSIGIEFDTPLSQDMLGYFCDAKVKNNSGLVFTKIVMLPWDSLNYNSTTIYLLDSNNRVYKYIISMNEINLKRDYYDTAIEKLKVMQDKGNIRNFMIFSETKLKLTYAIRQDMLVSAYGNKFDSLGQLNVSIPDNFKIAPGSKLYDVENKLGGLLGKDGDSYDIFTDTKGTVTLKNRDNQYRVYTNGLLEYKNTGDIKNEKGAKDQAFKKAIAFIEGIGLIPDNVQVYLSGVEELKDRYRFKFDYKVSNLPVYFDVDLNGKNEEGLQSAIVIESNSDDTISCQWLIRNIEILKDKKTQYNVNFLNILDNTFIEYPNIKQISNFSINDVVIGYILKDDGIGTKVDPTGLVMGGNNNIYSVKLPTKKSD